MPVHLSFGAKRGTSSLGGKIVGGLVSLFFIVIGLTLAGAILREAWQDLETRSWIPTDCTILESQPPPPQAGKDHASPTIRYEYRRDGQTFQSTQIHRRPQTFRDYQEVQVLLDRYRPQGRARCYVDPRQAGIAILERESPWLALVALFPLGFAVIGSVILWAVVFGQSKPARAAQAGADANASASTANPGNEPISSRATSGNRGAGCLVFFFLIFGGAGGLVLFLLFIKPWFQSRAADSWNRTPCTIIASEVRSHSDSDGTTYSVDILFEYRVNGRPYRSNRYSFVTGSSSGRDAKQAIVAQHPPGLETFCLVNPANPAEAVLNPRHRAAGWWVLLPLVFIGIGVGGIIWAVRLHRSGRSIPISPRTRESSLDPATRTSQPDLTFEPGRAISERGARRRSRQADGLTEADGSIPDPDGPDQSVTFRPGSNRLGKVLGTLLVGLFWNGIVSVFVFQWFKGLNRGSIDWFLGLFLIPFVVIGLVIIGAFFHSLLGLFAPRPTVTLHSRQLRPGSSTLVEWTLSGRTHVIEELRIELEGAEEATYRRGTDTTTDRHVFQTIPIARATPDDPALLRAGQGTLTLPADLMPSFASQNNKIVWRLRVHGRIRRFPDINDSFSLTILPAPPQEHASRTTRTDTP